VSVSAGAVMTWAADHSVTHSGWKVCLETPVSNDAFSVLSGLDWCTLSGDNCVENLNHGNHEECRISILRTGSVSSTHFDTESGFDFLTLNGQSYSGTAGPNGVSVHAGSVMTWTADYSVTHGGWKVCLVNDDLTMPPTPDPTPAPTAVAVSNDAFSVVSGMEWCNLSGDNCVENMHHGNHEACEISILRDGSVSSTHFDTESGFDFLTLNGESYSGTTGPTGVSVSAGAVMTWAADHSVTHSGWKVCLETPVSNDAFSVLSGLDWCTLSGDNCVENLNHGNHEECRISILRTGSVSSTHFDTESGFDFLTLNGQSYSGTAGPNGVSVHAGSVMTWTADYSVTHGGWKVCLVNDDLTMPPTPDPTPLPTPAPIAVEVSNDAFTVLSGMQWCTISGDNCIENMHHGNHEDCEILILGNGVLSSTHFDTESGYDFLTLDGQSYSGTTGPNGVSVSVGSVMTWAADYSVTHSGWRVCLDASRRRLGKAPNTEAVPSFGKAPEPKL